MNQWTQWEDGKVWSTERKKIAQNLKYLWDIIKWTNMHILEVSETEKERERDYLKKWCPKTAKIAESYKYARTLTNFKQDRFEENFIEAHYNQTNQAKASIMKTARKKWVIVHKRLADKIIGIFSGETLEVRWHYLGIFKVMKDKNCQLRILYLAKLSLKNKIEIKTFQINKSLGSSLSLDLTYKKC